MQIRVLKKHPCMHTPRQKGSIYIVWISVVALKLLRFALGCGKINVKKGQHASNEISIPYSSNL